MLYPSLLFDMVEIDEATGVRISMCGSQNASSSKFQSFFHLQVVLIFRVEHSIKQKFDQIQRKRDSQRAEYRPSQCSRVPDPLAE